jgi:sugar lactone lactonase YvrE
VRVRLYLALTLVLGTTGCAATVNPFAPLQPSPTLSGTVASAAGPISGAAVTLYLTGDTGPHSGASVLGHATSNANGSFTIHYARPSTGVVYAVALGGNTNGHATNSAIGLMGVAGRNGDYAGALTINEFTTVADEFALAQFLDRSGESAGASASNGTGIANAAHLALANLAAANGGPAPFWPAKARCSGASQSDNCDGLERIDALANALAACTTSAGASSKPCRELNALTHRRGTTLAAIHAIVLDPSRNVSGLFVLSRLHRGYEPTLATQPAAWFLALKYVGNGHEFDGPGLVAIDAAGNAWANNNYEFKQDHSIPTCGGKQVLELTPVGKDAPGAPFNGGGVDGVGWGITFDANKNVWVANFGFYGRNCRNKPPADSVSEMDSSGHPISPNDTGYTEGRITRPQGAVFDQSNNLWIANYGSTTMTEYVGGNHNSARILPHIGLRHPFGIAIDDRGYVWITSSGSSAVVALRGDGRALPGSPFTAGGMKRPLGDAFDSRGNLWVANSQGGSVSALDSSGAPLAGSPFSGGGIALPWGVTVDGNDNVWVADFSGSKPRVSELCGIARRGCAPGAHTGDPISPPQGFENHMLQRLTGITIDASGNVWVCNNWLPVPVQTNPGGDGLVEFVGIAGPVRTPMMGLPKQP